MRGGAAGSEFVELVCEFRSVRTEKCRFHTVVLRQRTKHVAVPPRKLRERITPIVHPLQRPKRGCEPRNQRVSVGKRVVAQRSTVIGWMQFARFAAAEFAKLGPKAL